MRKIDCAELHLKLEEIQSKRKAVGVDLASVNSIGMVNLPLSRKIKNAVKTLSQLVEKVYELVGVRRLSAITKEGVEVKFELKERLEYWRKFYKAHGVDWVTLPGCLSVSKEQASAMEKLMSEGFDYMLIIPSGLVDEYHEEIDLVTGKKTAKNRRYNDLHRLMREDNEEPFTDRLYDEDGQFEGAGDMRHGLRIILTKAVHKLADDKLFEKTLGKSLDALAIAGGLLTQYDGLTESEYLILARAYWEENKKNKHLDEDDWVWLPGSQRKMSGRVSTANFHSNRRHLSSRKTNQIVLTQGCRLAGVFPIEN